jgi:hypothetical protein
MRSLLLGLAAVAVMGLAFWAYRENYATQQAAKELAALHRQIGTLRDAIAVQRAEWAWLNRPDRLAELTAANFDRLGLLPMAPEQFSSAARLPDPLVPEAEVASPVDTAAQGPTP